jgi:hypothetical protein
MHTLTKLLERAKAAREPDRILDRDIHCLAMGKSARLCALGIGVPRYTRSFEAALTLLPPFVYVEISGGTDTGEPGVWPAVSIRWLRPGETDHKKWQGTVQGAPTFALAMCCAALEVRTRQQ